MSYPKVVALDTESVDEISSVVLTLTRLPLAGLFGADSLTIRSGGEASRAFSPVQDNIEPVTAARQSLRDRSLVFILSHSCHRTV